MIQFPFILDNFFDDPHEIRRVGLELVRNEHDCILNDHHSKYPGVRSKVIDCQYVCKELFLNLQPLFNFDLDLSSHTSFHITSSVHELGLIHSDPWDIAGLIYLNENPEKDSGTVLCSPLDPTVKHPFTDNKFLTEAVSTRDIDVIKKFAKYKKQYNKRNYKIDQVIENKFNRLVMYPGSRHHAPHHYFGNNLFNSRLVLVFWFNVP